MQRSVLVVGLSGVFAVLTAVLLIAAVATQSVFVLFVAAPFGFATYLMWMQASGNFAAMHQRRAERARAASDGRERGGFGAEARRTGGFGAGARRAAERARREAGASDPGGRTYGEVVADGPTPSEARRILDVGPNASDAEVRTAYRNKVKAVHPDTADGDEEQFKRVTEAYETLDERT